MNQGIVWDALGQAATAVCRPPKVQVTLRSPAQNDRESEVLTDGRGNHARKSLPEMMRARGVRPVDSRYCGWNAKCPCTGAEVVGLPAMAGCIPLYQQAEGRQPGLT